MKWDRHKKRKNFLLECVRGVAKTSVKRSLEKSIFCGVEALNAAYIAIKTMEHHILDNSITNTSSIHKTSCIAVPFHREKAF